MKENDNLNSVNNAHNQKNHFEEMIKAQNKKDLNRYGITLFDEFALSNDAKTYEIISRKIEKQLIKKTFIGEPTRNRKAFNLYIVKITDINWHNLQMLNIKGNDTLTKRVNLYNIFGAVLNYELILKNNFGAQILQAEDLNYDYPNFIIEPQRTDLLENENRNILKRHGFGFANNDVQTSLLKLIVDLEDWGINIKKIEKFIYELKPNITKQNSHALNTRLENLRKSHGTLIDLYKFAFFLGVIDNEKYR